MPACAFPALTEDAMLRDEQVAVLCDIAQSIAFADDVQGEVDRLIKEGYVAKDGDLYELTPKAEKILSERGASLNRA
ncbi:putative transcriptional regulator [Bradyrhizobium sp. USDA 3364]